METIFKNNKYSVKQDELGVQKYTVTSKPAPATLFKFYSLLEHNVNALKNHQFWASEPEDFNDLFDSKAFLIDFTRLDLQTAKELFDGDVQKSQIEEYWPESLLINGYVEKEYYTTRFSKFGIVSFSSNYTNEILWGLYTQNQGFCVELDYSMFPDNFQGPFPMNYVDQLEPIDIMRYGDQVSFLIQITQKKRKWKFEDEYRFIFKTGKSLFQLSHSMYTKHASQTEAIPRLVSYSKEAIKAIYLGFTFIKGECVHNIGKDNYEVCLISIKRELKAKLLDMIIINGYNCFMIEQESNGMQLGSSKYTISRIEDFKYRFYKY